MNFQVAEFADEVNEDYILRALKFGYQGRSYTDKFSDKLVKVLLSDYKKKVHNLAWYFKDENGRVRNYKVLGADPDKLMKDAVNNDNLISFMVEQLKYKNAEFTSEEFMDNRCTINNQRLKISKVLLERDRFVEFGYDLYSKRGGRIHAGDAQLDRGKCDINEYTIIEYNTTQMLQVKRVLKHSDVKIEIADALSGYTQTNIENAINKVKASALTISMDLVDMITCSTGDCRSCLSVDNIHSGGAIQNFRTEFALITFTSKGSDRFSKRGRSWIFLRATERGFKRDLPFWKQQKAYGSVTHTHQKLLNSHIGDAMKELLGNPKMEFAEFDDWLTYQCSPNAYTGGTQHSHSSAPGYLDTDCSGDRAFYYPSAVPRDDFKYSRELLLPFKDMLTLDGEESNSVSFHKPKNHSGYYGASQGNTYEVICKASGTIVLDTDAVQIDGEWYRKDILGKLIAGDKTVEVKTVATEVVEESYDDIDIDEDF